MKLKQLLILYFRYSKSIQTIQTPAHAQIWVERHEFMLPAYVELSFNKSVINFGCLNSLIPPILLKFSQE